MDARHAPRLPAAGSSEPVRRERVRWERPGNAESGERVQLHAGAAAMVLIGDRLPAVTSAAVSPDKPSVTKSVSSTVPKYSGEPRVFAVKCGGPEYSHQFGSHQGNVGLRSVRTNKEASDGHQDRGTGT